MARQAGHIKIEGTIGGLCFYRLGEEYYVRRKSSLSRRRVLKDPCFTRSRAAAERFGLAVKLAAQVYRRLPAADKGHGVIGRMTAVANRILCDGHKRDAALLLLERVYLHGDKSGLLQSPHVVSAAEKLSKQLVGTGFRRLGKRELRRIMKVQYGVPFTEERIFALARGAPG